MVWIVTGIINYSQVFYLTINCDSNLWLLLPVPLQAYSVYDGEIGYCQGQSFLAAVLLLHVSSPVKHTCSKWNHTEQTNFLE